MNLDNPKQITHSINALLEKLPLSPLDNKEISSLISTYYKVTKQIINLKKSCYVDVDNYKSYVYLILHKKTGMCYIGVRYSKSIKFKDLHKDLMEYKSSSTNENFKRDIEDNKDDYYFEIIQTFKSEFEAINAEALLHQIYQVDRNTMFYNFTAESFIDYTVYSKQITLYDLDYNTIMLTYNNIDAVSKQYDIKYKKLYGFYIEYKIINGKEIRSSIDKKLFTSKRFIDSVELYDENGEILLLNYVNSQEISKKYNIPLAEIQEILSTRTRNVVRNKLFVGYDNYKLYILDVHTLIDYNGNEVKFNLNNVQQMYDKYDISKSNGNIHKLIRGESKSYKNILFRDMESYNYYIKRNNSPQIKPKEINDKMYKTFRLNINNGTYDIVFYSSSTRTFIGELWRTDSDRKMAKLHFLLKENMEAYYEIECKNFIITNGEEIKSLQLHEMRKFFNSTSGNFQKFASGRSKMMKGWRIVKEQQCNTLLYNNTYELK